MLFPLNLWFSCWNHLLSFLFLGASLLSLKVYVGSNEWEGYWERAEMEPSLQIKMHATVERAVNEKIFYGWVGWRWCWGLCGVLTARLRATQWNINSDSAAFSLCFLCVCVCAPLSMWAWKPFVYSYFQSSVESTTKCQRLELKSSFSHSSKHIKVVSVI